ncbi:hypothetical protein ACFE04_031158 [Oxalis oulophora]
MPSHNSISVNNCFIKTIAVCSIVALVIIAAPLIWFFSSSRIIQRTSAAEADRVVNLPGQPRVKFSHYAGYVALDDPDQKALFYWFFEAEEDPANKPLALWLHGGRYAPLLINVMYEENQKASVGSSIDIRGYMVGNALLNNPTDTNGMYEFAWMHGIISDQLHSNLLKECTFGSDNMTEKCSVYYDKFLDAFQYFDMYGIYTPKCRTKNEHPKHPKQYDPCADYYPMAYLNRKDVQRALHANVTELPYPYMACRIKDWRNVAETILPIIRKLLNAGLRIWVYSGDTDARVPVTSTSMSLKELGLQMEEERRPWFYNHRMAGVPGPLYTLSRQSFITDAIPVKQRSNRFKCLVGSRNIEQQHMAMIASEDWNDKQVKNDRSMKLVYEFVKLFCC